MRLKRVICYLIFLSLLCFLGCSLPTSTEFSNDEAEPITWLGGTYIGGLSRSLPHGIGTWENQDGYSYEGEWEYGLKNGYGVWHEPRGEQYDGEWIDNLYHGRGVWNNNNGDEYVGDFEYGLFHGFGTWISSDGMKYEGGFAYGEKHGEGVITNPDGSVEKGLWVKGIRSPDTATSEKSQTTSREIIATDDRSTTNQVVSLKVEYPMRFFESGEMPAEYGKRRYSTTFNKDKIEYIYWELIVVSDEIHLDREFSINFTSSPLGINYAENYKMPIGLNQIVITGPIRGKIYKPEAGVYVIDYHISDIKPRSQLSNIFGANSIKGGGFLTID